MTSKQENHARLSSLASYQPDCDHFRSISEEPGVIAYEVAVDSEGNVETAHLSQRLSSMLGAEPARLIGSGLWETCFHPDDRQSARTTIQRALAQGEASFDLEYRLLCLDDRVVWFRDQARLFRDQAGCQRIRGILSDVTELRTLQSLLGEAGVGFQALVEQLPAVLYIDHYNGALGEFDTAYINPQVKEILGVEPEEWVDYSTGDEWEMHLHPEDRDRVLRQYESFLSGGPFVEDYRMARPDGSIVWIRDRGRMIRDESGKPTMELGLMIDVTEVKEAEDRVQQQVEAMQRVDALGRELTRLLLQESDLNQLLRTLADTVANPVILEDPAHQLVEFATRDVAVEEVLHAWDAHSREGHDDERGGGVQRQEGSTPCIWIPIVLRDEHWGRIHVLEIERQLNDADQIILDRAAAAVGLWLLSERSTADLSEHAGSALVADILEGRYRSTREIARRAAGLGFDLEAGDLGALVVLPASLPTFMAKNGLSPRDRRTVISTILRETRNAVRESGCRGLVAPDGDRVVVILGLSDASSFRSVMEALGHDIKSRIGTRFPGLNVAIGASNKSKLEFLHCSLDEALEGASYCARVAGCGDVYHFRDLGVQRLLTTFSTEPQLARFVEAELGPLLAHDAKSSAPLLPTLREVLEHGGRKQPAARALHIERRTLYHRIARIESLIGVDLQEHGTQVQLAVALEGLDLLRPRDV